jgi:predicted dehydrogenase
MDRRQFVQTSAALPLAASAWAAGAETIKIGLIGCGGRGNAAAAQAMTADDAARLVAMGDIVMDRVKTSRAALAKQKPGQVTVKDDHCFAGFDAYRSVIAASDVVLIACAAKFHPMYLMAAVRAGKHVFVEKPHGIDPAGIKVVKAACELARQKNLSVLSGLQSRFFGGFRETMQRIHEGAIGDIVAIQETWLRPPYVLHPRTPGLNEIEYQASNQYHFHWLSGDDVPQTLVHNFDRARWALKEQNPVKCWGMGGRSTLKGEIYGSVFDHHSMVFEFASGVRLYAACRTIDNCYNENSTIVLGTKGKAFVRESRIEGETNWKYPRRLGGTPQDNPYQVEHDEFFRGIRHGKPINSGHYMTGSTLMGIMGQISCYTGKEITWKEISESDFYFAPRPEEVTRNTEPPVKPGPDGSYPVYTPGVTKLL